MKKFLETREVKQQSFNEGEVAVHGTISTLILEKVLSRLPVMDVQKLFHTGYPQGRTF